MLNFRNGVALQPPPVVRAATCFGLLTFTFVLLSLAACSAGRDFSRPPPGSLHIDETTRQDILSRYGEPYKSGSQISNGYEIDNVIYSYASNDDPHVEDVTPARGLTLFFLDDLLVGYQFNSSFRDDHSDFDETVVPRIKEGEDTCEEVVGMLGKPSGEYIFPMIKERNSRGIGYSYTHTKVGFASMDMYVKSVLVTCDESGVVKEVEYSSSGQK